MIVVLIVLQVLTIVLLALRLRGDAETGLSPRLPLSPSPCLFTPAPPCQFVATPPAEPPAPIATVQVLKRRGEIWAHHGWVRPGSDAWKKAYDTPGFALRDRDDPAAEVIKGKQ